MIYGSVCSGIESASVAWGPLGWRAAFLSEIAAFPRAVLKHRYPGVPLHGDFTTIEKGQYDPIDVLIGGTPCQDFSVAGLRAGITGERGNLTLQFICLAQRLRPTWIVFENVPGLLSDDGGRAFGAFLGGLAVVGYGFAYRVLDAQFFGLAQRRERVFVVGYLGDWRPAAAVLFERDSLQRNPPPRRGARQGVAGSLTARAGNGSRPAGGTGNLVAAQPLGLGTDGELARALNACHTASGRHDVSVDTFVATAFKASHFTRGKDGAPSDIAALRARDQSRGVGKHANAGGQVAVAFNLSPGAGSDGVPSAIETNLSSALTATSEAARNGRGTHVVAVDTTQITHPENRSNPQPGDPCHPLAAQGHPPAIAFQDRFRGDDGRGYDRPPPVMEEQTGTLETVKPWNVAYEQEGGPTEFLPQSSRVYMEDGVAPTLQGVGTHNGQRTPTVAFQTRVARNGRGQPEEEIVPALNGADAGATSDMRPCVAYQCQGSNVGEMGTLRAGNGAVTGGVPFIPALSFQERGREGGRSIEMQADVAYALTSPDGGGRAQERNILSPTMKVRRLTPTECERLQGFPDGWTLVPYRGKPAADGNRYAALGNSMAVPVIRKLGERILLVDRLLRSGQTQESPAPRVGQQPAQGSDEPAHAPMASGKHED